MRTEVTVNYWGCRLSEQLLCRASVPGPRVCAEGSASVSGCRGWRLCRAWRAEGSRAAPHTPAPQAAPAAQSGSGLPAVRAARPTAQRRDAAAVPGCHRAGLAAAGRSDWERTPPLGQTGDAIPGAEHWHPTGEEEEEV